MPMLSSTTHEWKPGFGGNSVMGLLTLFFLVAITCAEHKLLSYGRAWHSIQGMIKKGDL